MFSQVTTQPQIAVALTQLGNILNSARQGSSVIYPRSRFKSSRVTSQQTHRESSESLKNEVSQELNLPELEVDFKDCLSIVTKEETMQYLASVMEAMHKDLERSDEMASATDSSVSAETFFENKTGFTEDSLHTSTYRQPVWPFLGMTGTKLKVSPAMMTSLQSSRGFMTDHNVMGLGMKKKKDKDAKDKDKTDGYNKVAKFEIDESHKGKAISINVNMKNEETEGGWAKKHLKKWGIYLFAATWIWLAYQIWKVKAVGGGNLGGLMNSSMGNNEVNPEMVDVTLKDVKGINEVKEELEDIVKYLANPEKFTKVGARLPKGILLVGPPGVGKTMLAKAVAGEAGVPFFQCTGSEFDEVFVGVGAKRVRELFKSARQKAPCILFIDEIDAVAHKRVTSVWSTHANQTINQLLSEMDGFSSTEGVIVIGATNKKDVLDKAVTRPGRFDVQIEVARPDRTGRKELFDVYLGKVKSSLDVDTDRLSMATSGFTGADISNIVNQAALIAVKEGFDAVNMDHINAAVDKQRFGPPRKDWKVSKEDKMMTAIHEAGHTIALMFSKDAPKINKVTIVPRGGALGSNTFLNTKDVHHSQTKSEYLALIDVAFGGRIAEEIFSGADNISAGCSSDFQKATQHAHNMVRHLGMTDKVGHRIFPENSKMSNEQRAVLDAEINKILKESYDRTKRLLESHKEDHRRIVEALMMYGTIDLNELDDILKGVPIRQGQKPKPAPM